MGVWFALFLWTFFSIFYLNSVFLGDIVEQQQAVLFLAELQGVQPVNWHGGKALYNSPKTCYNIKNFPNMPGCSAVW